MSDWLIFLAGIALGVIACRPWRRQRFIVNIDKENGEATIEELNRPRKKIEFIGEPTRKEAEEAEKPEALSGFIKTFKRPASQEEEEEI